jgi:transposase InsO family protein
MASASAVPAAGSRGTAQAAWLLWRIDAVFAAPSGGRSIRRTAARLELRYQRLHLRDIARLLRAPFSTVARTLSRLGLGRLRNLDPKPPVQRYKWERPGDLIHIDVKSLARFRKVGRRITGDRQQGRSTGVDYDKFHVTVEDATRLAYIKVLADEQKPTVIGFLSRGIAWFNARGIECRRVMNDNGPAYVSNAFAKACRILGLRHIRTRLYTPRTNGKAEQFKQTLCPEWAYGMSFQNSEERIRWLPRYLSIYSLRMHAALGWRSPQQRLVELLR